MVTKCCVCGERYVAGKTKLRRLPCSQKDPGRRELWIQAINKGPYWNPKTAVVCEKHFRDNDYENTRVDGTRSLKSCAVPSVNLQKPSRRLVLGDITNVNSVNNVSNVVRASCSRGSSCISHGTLKQSCSPATPSSVSTTLAHLDHDYVGASPKSVPIQQEVIVKHVEQPGEVESIVVDCVPAQHLEGEVDCYLKVLAESEKLNQELKKQLKLREESLLKLNKENYSLRRVLKNERKAKARLQNNIQLTAKNLSRVLGPDQIKSLGRNSTRGMKFSDASVETALNLKSQCGTSAYQTVAGMHRHPKTRTLQRRTEHIKFECGLLQETFDSLRISVPRMGDKERDCMVALDEMAVTPNGNLIDPSTNKPIGKCTLPGHNGKATANKALVVMLGGISTRWKLVSAFYFSGSRGHKNTAKQSRKFGQGLKKVLVDVITEAEKIGLKVHCVANDMGSDNRAMWNAFGISAKANKAANSSVPHPCDPSRKLHFMADVPHVFKNIVGMLFSNKTITLPQDIVDEFGLPTNQVKWEHIKELVQHEKKFELKIAFRAKWKDIERKGHFDKMQVGRARALINNQTKVGLEMLAKKLNKPELLTTAWFIGVVSRWFDLSASRSHTMALSLSNPVAYQKAIDHLKLTSRLFQKMIVGKGDQWKPCQEGVMIACSSIIQMADFFLNIRGYKFLLTSRFSQDFLENLFSQIRRRHVLPTTVQFKYVLKEIFLAGVCSKPPKGSSYDHDEGHMLISFLSLSKKNCQERQATASEETVSIDTYCPPILDNDIYSIIDDWELDIIYDMAGCAIHSMFTVNHLSRQCPCIVSMLWSGPHPHPFASLTRAKNYKEGALIEVSDECFTAIAKCEIMFRILRAPLLNEKNVKVLEYICKEAAYVWRGFPTPTCHTDFFELLTERFFTIRFKQFSSTGKEASQDLTPIYASRSVAMREVVKIL